MAENEENQDQEQEEGKSSGKKKIIILAIVGILVIAVGAGVTFFLLSGDDGAEEEEVAAEDIKLPALYFDMKPKVLVTLGEGKKRRYMQVSLNAMARDQAAIDALEFHMPLIRSQINSLFSSQDFEQMQTEQGKLDLQKATLETINGILTTEGEPNIEDIYFTNFVLQ